MSALKIWKQVKSGDDFYPKNTGDSYYLDYYDKNYDYVCPTVYGKNNCSDIPEEHKCDDSDKCKMSEIINRKIRNLFKDHYPDVDAYQNVHSFCWDVIDDILDIFPILNISYILKITVHDMYYAILEEQEVDYEDCIRIICDEVYDCYKAEKYLAPEQKPLTPEQQLQNARLNVANAISLPMRKLVAVLKYHCKQREREMLEFKKRMEADTLPIITRKVYIESDEEIRKRYQLRKDLESVNK